MEEPSILVAVVILTAHAAFGSVFTNRMFEVNGTNFAFRFEDDSLSFTNKCRIAEDVVLARTSWPGNSEIRFDVAGKYDGHIEDNDVIEDPYAEFLGLNFPRDFVTVNGLNCLFISTELSEAYTNSFAFADDNSDAFASVQEFISLFTSGSFSNTPPQQLRKIVYYPNATSNAYEQSALEIMSEMQSQRYGVPRAVLKIV